MRRAFPCLFAGILALASCARTAKIEQEKQFNPITPGGTPLIRSKTPGNADPGTPVVAGNPAEKGTPLSVTPEEDIVYTNMDDPESLLPELSEVLGAAPKRRGPWEESETIARQRSVREGKPLLIWFTDSARSPMCKALSQELFSTPDFGSWASEHIVRLRIDANIKEDDPSITLDEKNTRLIDKKNYVARIKKKYKVLGQPTLLLLDPSGAVLGRYRGYKRGQADFTWGLIKHGQAVSENTNREWRAGLEKKGYREWSDRKDRKVFAKLTGYHEGTLILIEPDGTRCRTHENKLSSKDQDWIDSQKKLRNL